MEQTIPFGVSRLAVALCLVFWWGDPSGQEIRAAQKV
jgi:hypothetical protein